VETELISVMQCEIIVTGGATDSGSKNFNPTWHHNKYKCRICEIEKLQAENEKLKRIVNCRYNHKHTITGSGYCSKCGWHENIEVAR
jgi:hypothetical protein